MKIEYSFSDTVTESKVVELYSANGWSSAKKPSLLMPTLPASHSLLRIEAKLDKNKDSGSA